MGSAFPHRRQDIAWTTAWTTAPQRPGAGFAPNWSAEGFAGQTLRQTVRLSVGARTLRVRLSNRYGSTPLRVAGLTIAQSAGGAAVKADSLRELTKDGEPSFTVAVGARVCTDAVDFLADALESVTITLYLAEPSGPATYHAQALATTYLAAGDRRADADGSAFTETSQSSYYLDGIETDAADGARGGTGAQGGPGGPGIVVIGDSLTDGTGSTPDTDQRFPDLLAWRYAAAGRPRPVLNQGIGGNRVTVDSRWLGDRAVARFGHDVLSQPGVGTVVILAGINDIAISEIEQDSPYPVLAPYTDVSADQVIEGHRAMIRAARAAGLRTVGATLSPVRGSAFSTPRSEAKREDINTWIRRSGEYDAVIDLAHALGDTLDPAHDSGDKVHLNDAGYRAMAEAVDLADL